MVHTSKLKQCNKYGNDNGELVIYEQKKYLDLKCLKKNVLQFTFHCLRRWGMRVREKNWFSCSVAASGMRSRSAGTLGRGMGSRRPFGISGDTR